MKHVPIYAVCFLPVTWWTPAQAASPQLNGAYGFTGTAACLVAPGNSGTGTPTNPTGPAGFNSALQPLNNSNSFSDSFSVEGIRTFNGDGTGTVKGTAVSITVRPTPGPPPAIPAFPAAASSADFSFSFTYTVDGQGGWSATMVPGRQRDFYVGPAQYPDRHRRRDPAHHRHDFAGRQDVSCGAPYASG